jgi:hypothetical protein
MQSSSLDVVNGEKLQKVPMRTACVYDFPGQTEDMLDIYQRQDVDKPGFGT